MSNEQTANDETLKRWTAKRRVALVLEIRRGETTAAEAARRHGLTVADIVGRGAHTAEPVGEGPRPHPAGHTE